MIFDLFSHSKRGEARLYDACREKGKVSRGLASSRKGKLWARGSSLRPSSTAAPVGLPPAFQHERFEPLAENPCYTLYTTFCVPKSSVVKRNRRK